MKVLVVDDVSANRLVLVALLRRIGYEASAAAGSEEAERLFLSERPEAVLTDLHLGEDRDGTDLILRLHRLPGGDSVRFGLMTGDTRDIAVESGVVDAVLEKPVGMDALQSFLKGA